MNCVCNTHKILDLVILRVLSNLNGAIILQYRYRCVRESDAELNLVLKVML